MDNKTRELDYEESANEYWRWVLAAEDLLIAANILEKKYKNALQSIRSTQVDKMPLETQVLAPMIYIKAKSLELFLKALYIKQGKRVTKNGIFTYKLHNLVRLCQNTGISLGNAQKKLLEKMTGCITFWGTYPVPLECSEWRPDTDGIVGLQPIYSWGLSDDTTFEEVLKQIRHLVDLKNDRNLPWSQTLIKKDPDS